MMSMPEDECLYLIPGPQDLKKVLPIDQPSFTPGLPLPSGRLTWW